MLKVFITVDTELSLLPKSWTRADLERTMARDIYGETAAGEFGVPYQIRKLNEHGLKASFFVESLFADAVGAAPLRTIVDLIETGGQEAQLHAHTEWLPLMSQPLLAGKTGVNLKDFSEDEQTRVVGRALENLRQAGAQNVCAFRAGNYGANFDTLRALSRNGIRFDTSYNVYYLHKACALNLPVRLTQPAACDGVYEIPISFFRDWPTHYRHVQLTACSFAEIAAALYAAWKRQWFSFVIVSHSFELLNGQKRRAGASVADHVAIRRFDRLCQLLANHRDRFETTFFRDLDPASIPTATDRTPLRSPIRRTVSRYAEQLARRIS